MSKKESRRTIRGLIIIALAAILGFATMLLASRSGREGAETNRTGGTQSLSKKAAGELTAEMLAAYTDEDLEPSIIDFIIEAKIGDEYDREYEIVTGLSKGMQYLYATWMMEAEVNNGGFHQFFFNSTGRFAREALEGCRVFGAAQYAELMKQAIEADKKGESPARDAALDALDDRFYGLDENLSKLRIQYIRAHPEEFVIGR